MRVLVTGATGLIGANLTGQLLEEGIQVRVLVRDRERAGRILSSKCDFIVGDITDPDSLIAAVKNCQIVYHVAGLPEQWFKDPEIFEKVNVQGTRNILRAAQAAEVKRVVYTSTIDVFQAARGESYDESIIDPDPKGTYYERSKQAADRIAVEFLNEGLDIVFIHPSGVYGPGPLGSPGPNGLVADLIQGRVPMLLPGGFPVVLASDCARGHILAAQKARAGERFILSESYLELIEFAHAVAQVAHIKKIPAVMPLWFARVFAFLGEGLAKFINKAPLLPEGQLIFLQWQARPLANRATQILGWQATPFKQGLIQTIQHLQRSGILPSDKKILKNEI